MDEERGARGDIELWLNARGVAVGMTMVRCGEPGSGV
jgi:hypothetical protein